MKKHVAGAESFVVFFSHKRKCQPLWWKWQKIGAGNRPQRKRCFLRDVKTELGSKHRLVLYRPKEESRNGGIGQRLITEMSTEYLCPDGSMEENHEGGGHISTLSWQRSLTQPGRGRRHTPWDPIQRPVVAQPLCMVQTPDFCRPSHVILGTSAFHGIWETCPPPQRAHQVKPVLSNLSLSVSALLPLLRGASIMSSSGSRYKNPTHIKPGCRKEILMYSLVVHFYLLLGKDVTGFITQLERSANNFGKQEINNWKDIHWSPVPGFYKNSPFLNYLCPQPVSGH